MSQLYKKKLNGFYSRKPQLLTLFPHAVERQTCKREEKSGRAMQGDFKLLHTESGAGSLSPSLVQRRSHCLRGEPEFRHRFWAAAWDLLEASSGLRWLLGQPSDSQLWSSSFGRPILEQMLLLQVLVGLCDDFNFSNQYLELGIFC